MEAIKYEKIGNHEACVFYDEEHGLFTIYYNGNGGAIVSDVNIDKAKEKFINAMAVSVAVFKLLNIYNRLN